VLVPVGNRQRCHGADALDPLATDEDDAIAHRRGAGAVDERAAGERDRPCRRLRYDTRLERERQRRNQPHCNSDPDRSHTPLLPEHRARR